MVFLSHRMWFFLSIFCHGDGPNFGGEAKPGMAERAGARGGAPAAHAAVRGLAATLRAENTVLRDVSRTGATRTRASAILGHSPAGERNIFIVTHHIC